MTSRKTLSDKGVAVLKPRAGRYSHPDPELLGHYVRVTPTGAKSYAAVARDPAGKQIWATIDSVDKVSIDEARDRAREAIKRIRSGLPPFEPPPSVPETFGAVAETWLQRHVRAKGHRSEKEITRVLNVYVLPSWRDKPLRSIRRTDIAALLDAIEDRHGARQADISLSIIGRISNWFAVRDDDFRPPMARGMRRQSPSEQRRTRILDDTELRTVWKTAETGGVFGAFVRLALLTAQRREKLTTMRWEDISLDGVWRIPLAPREKATGGALILPAAAMAIIQTLPRLAANPHVFAGRRGGAFNGFSKLKALFEAKLPADIPRWTLHDLRRTSRSLMSRAGVQSDIAELVLGHVLGGIRATYDLHRYEQEKGDALKRLAALIETIVNPPAANVVQLRGPAG